MSEANWCCQDGARYGQPCACVPGCRCGCGCDWCHDCEKVSAPPRNWRDVRAEANLDEAQVAEYRRRLDEADDITPR